RRFPYIKKTIVDATDLDGSVFPKVTTDYQYDNFGNATQVKVETYEPNHPDYAVKTTVSTYSNNTSKWYIGRLATATVTSEVPDAPMTQADATGAGGMAAGYLGDTELPDPEPEPDPEPDPPAGPPIVGEVLTVTSVNGTLQSIELNGLYTNPVVVALSQSAENPTQSQNPGVINSMLQTNVRNQSGKDYLDIKQIPSRRTTGTGTASPMAITTRDVTVLVVEEGTHDLPGFGLVKAGIRTNAPMACSQYGSAHIQCYHDGFAAVDFSQTPVFTADPIVLAHVQNASQFVAPRQDIASLSASGVDLAFSYDQLASDLYGTAANAPTQDIGWIAFEHTSGTTNGIEIQTGTVQSTHSSNPKAYFTSNFASPPSVLVSMGSKDGRDPTVARVHEKSVSDMKVHALEEQSQDYEIWHNTWETLNWVAFSDDGTLRTDIVPPPAGDITVGEVLNVASVNGTLQSIELNGLYTNPVVVALSQSAENPTQSQSPGVINSMVQTDVRRQGGKDYLDIKQIPSRRTTGTGTASPMAITTRDVTVLVVEEGTHDLPGFGIVKAGIRTNAPMACSQNGSAHIQCYDDGFAAVDFSQNPVFTADPIVLAHVQNASQFVAPRQDIATLSPSGVDLAFSYDSLASDLYGTAANAPTQDIGWIAFEHTSGTTNGIEIQTGTVQSKHYSNPTAHFPSDFASPPSVLVSMGSKDGKDATVARVHEKSVGTMKVHALEEQSQDYEIWHNLWETLNWVAFGSEGTLTKPAN
ncbi:MAG: hypothetical protein AAF723_04530, partial [Pseudomonadota bacterium]